MQDFPANSRRTQGPPEPREKIEQITSAKTVQRKRGLGRQFKETFIGGDPRMASEHVIFNVLIPSVRDMLYDAFDAGMRTLIFGDNPNKARRGGGVVGGYSGLGHVAYNRMSQPAARPQEPRRSLSRQARARHDFDELVIPTRQEAEEVLDQMFDILSRFGSVSIAHLYEMTGIESSHTDMKWGWVALPGAKAIRLRQGGFLLDLPEPEPLG